MSRFLQSLWKGHSLTKYCRFCFQKMTTFPPLLVSNTCMLLSAIVGELAALATGTEVSSIRLNLEEFGLCLIKTRSL